MIKQMSELEKFNIGVWWQGIDGDALNVLLDPPVPMDNTAASMTPVVNWTYM